MKDLDAKLRLKARNELLKWLHKPHEEPELSDFEQGYLEAMKMIGTLLDALNKISRTDYRGNRPQESVLAFRAIEAFNEELES